MGKTIEAMAGSEERKTRPHCRPRPVEIVVIILIGWNCVLTISRWGGNRKQTVPHTDSVISTRNSTEDENRTNLGRYKRDTEDSSMKYLSVCGFQVSTTTRRAVIRYSKALQPLTQSPDSGHSFRSGTFKAGFSGVYSVSWGLLPDHIGRGESKVLIYPRKNRRRILDDDHGEQGGRTVLVRLDKGNTLDLYCSDCRAKVWDITFCVSLVHQVAKPRRRG